MEKYAHPTGYLFVDDYTRGKLETLSIGDYGKHKNIKADFLGYKNEIHGVENGYCMPLQEKWVITLSTQYGCPMKCTFCDVPNIKFNGNVSFNDLKKQFYSAISLFPSVKYTERLNLHFARMGDPIFNEDVFLFSEWIIENKLQIRKDTGLSIETLHPVLTTSLPKKLKPLKERILRWCDIKNKKYNGQANIQFSINSTCEDQRKEMFGDSSITIEELSEIGTIMPEPMGRKYCLNFAYSTDFIIDAKLVAKLFDKDKFMIKITPIHNNNACEEHGIKTIGGYDSFTPYKQPEEDLKAEGFDVLIFVPSLDEENGLVTCGNAILGGSNMTSDDVIKIKGL